MNETTAFKLLRIRDDGTLGSLFINRQQRIETGVWLKAESHPTKGYTVRPGWHAVAKPHAPHLSMKGRRWFRVKVRNYVEHLRPASQGSMWYIAEEILIERSL